ncbi:sn-glycerol-3-phosphate ABC transporter ATP-binding protein UgpC [Conexibacter stalactiti]|uniref:Sn-glycerol-3-phosphate ABC transporter ATP-binding protein UgpC n=1 Tax=Conexibacter stalactiti TaxID=1940611 RepID=A0ABU4HPX4_9ACTN|nr:sn-glycerol-3-phosphate ABC transporter ATP-binding protein UgpC [Conexibacter stalactiti]MDW5595336.1 sn-glycerol-3-phosphate ABC transporter ATP-binding protein UgpC [Conexibacter stalactiti]MEC5035978.1 sn-glycerol-3-phosphate ABC transporter ATP-binding protein UgpC [Conexibacter stalactiti]
MGAIHLNGVSKVYEGGGDAAVDDVTLEVRDGEFMVLVGPSGCGKSTLLRMIAGLERVSGGQIVIGERDVTDVPPPDRDIAMVFQNYALYPHKTVRENLAFGLKQRKVDKAVIDARVADAARMLGLEEMLQRKPSQLSGGQRQRVAIGRAMVREPAAFLLDEPLSNLDAKLRTTMRGELARLHARLGITTVYVTHDQVEAMTLGTRVAVLRGGVVQQCAAPQELYRRPKNLFVAAFIGSPAMNLVEARIEGGCVRFAGHAIPLPDALELRGATRDVILGIRPAAFTLDGPRADQSLPRIEVAPDLVEHLGDEVHVSFGVDARPVQGDAVLAAEEDVHDTRLLVEGAPRARFVAVLDGRRAPLAGEPVGLRVDNEQLYFFDPADGEALGAPVGEGSEAAAAA